MGLLAYDLKGQKAGKFRSDWCYCRSSKPFVQIELYRPKKKTTRATLFRTQHDKQGLICLLKSTSLYDGKLKVE